MSFEHPDSPDYDAQEEQTEQELTYAEILSNLTLNREVIITIPIEEEEATKTGLKNLKAKQNLRMKAEGLPKVEEIFRFVSTPSKEYADYIDLHIVLERTGTVRVKKMRIPDDSL